MAKRRANGEGSIRKRSDGRWEGRCTAGYNNDGKRIIKNMLGKSQGEVKEKLKAALEAVQGLYISRRDEYTVGQGAQTWFELYAKPNIRPSMAEYYNNFIRFHIVPKIGDIKLSKLIARDIQKLYNDLKANGRVKASQKETAPGLSSSYVRGVHMMLRNCLQRAVKEHLILRNPTEDCIVPKVQKTEMKILYPEDISAYLKTAAARRTLPVPPALREHLKQISAPAGFVVPDTKGKAMSQTAFRVMWHYIECRTAGAVIRTRKNKLTGEPEQVEQELKLGDKIPNHNVSIELDFCVTPHLLRHTYATNLIRSGADPKTVQYLLGHATAAVTMDIYAHAEKSPEITGPKVSSALNFSDEKNPKK